jgi:methylated-DNA-[protein]-cysteine S-methyltransferase
MKSETIDAKIKELLFDRVPAPKGAPFEAVLYAVDGDKLCAVDFAGYESRMDKLLKRRYGNYRFVEAKNPQGFGTRIAAYLAGDLDAINDLPVSLGGTEFQQRAWLALRKIPVGQTASYAQQAARIGKPAAVRALGAANGQNPVAIVLPCHRVIGSGGALTGFGGGIPTKAWLLRHEGALLA